MTVRQLGSEFLDDQFGVNRRLPRTLRLLMFKPGFLTTEYFDGRVRQYIPPLRLYLLTSLVFFALFLATESSSVNVQRERAEARAELQADTALQRRLQTNRERGPMIGIRIDPSDTTNWLANPDINLGNATLNRIAERRLKEFAVFGEDEGTRRLVRAVVSQMPTVFFILLPLYAFLLWLFFRRQRRFYVEHFIMGLHLHAFGFLMLLPLPALDAAFLPGIVSSVGDFIAPFLFLWIFAYIFFALRRVYRQSRLVTGIKYFFLWILYIVFFGCGVVLSFLLALTTG